MGDVVVGRDDAARVRGSESDVAGNDATEPVALGMDVVGSSAAGETPEGSAAGNEVVGPTDVAGTASAATDAVNAGDGVADTPSAGGALAVPGIGDPAGFAITAIAFDGTTGPPVPVGSAPSDDTAGVAAAVVSAAGSATPAIAAACAAGTPASCSAAMSAAGSLASTGSPAAASAWARNVLTGDGSAVREKAGENGQSTVSVRYTPRHGGMLPFRQRRQGCSGERATSVRSRCTQSRWLPPGREGGRSSDSIL